MFKISKFFPVCTKCLRQSHIKSIKMSLSTNNQNLDMGNDPIKYSVSPASQYKAKNTRTGVIEERLWYEPYVIVGSIAVFMVYFCILREENDVDKELGLSLYSRIEGLEEHQLRLSLKYNEENGLNTVDIIKRLQEIEKEKHK